MFKELSDCTLSRRKIDLPQCLSSPSDRGYVVLGSTQTTAQPELCGEFRELAFSQLLIDFHERLRTIRLLQWQQELLDRSEFGAQEFTEWPLPTFMHDRCQ